MTDELKIEIVKDVCGVVSSVAFGCFIVRLFRGWPSKVTVADHNDLVHVVNDNADKSEECARLVNQLSDDTKIIEKKLKILAESDSKLAKKFEEVDYEC